jgi:hypothetical protein
VSPPSPPKTLSLLVLLFRLSFPASPLTLLKSGAALNQVVPVFTVGAGVAFAAVDRVAAAAGIDRVRTGLPPSTSAPSPPE